MESDEESDQDVEDEDDQEMDGDEVNIYKFLNISLYLKTSVFRGV